MARPNNPYSGPRPYAWHYKDPFDHERHLPYLRFRAQCLYRKEAIELTIEDWFDLWKDPLVWAQRGRGSDNYSITRIDRELPWRYDNCVIITRREQAQASQRRGVEIRLKKSAAKPRAKWGLY